MAVPHTSNGEKRVDNGGDVAAVSPADGISKQTQRVTQQLSHPHARKPHIPSRAFFKSRSDEADRRRQAHSNCNPKYSTEGYKIGSGLARPHARVNTAKRQLPASHTFFAPMTSATASSIKSMQPAVRP